MTHTIRKFIQIIGCTIVITSLLGCNEGSSSGGNSSQTTSSTPALPAATVLSASDGNLDAYVGTWTSDCGMTASIGGTSKTKSAVNVYKLTRTSSTLLTGTLEQYQFSDSQCTVSASIAGLPNASELVTIKYVAKTNLGTPTSASSNFTGTANKVTITHQANSSAAIISSTDYIAMKGSTTMLMTVVLPFSAYDLTYAKH